MKMLKGKTLKEWLPIVLLVAINLVIGIFVVRDYGQSWDEPGNYRYAYHSLDNYYNLFHGLPVTDFNELHLDQKGPAFFMLAGLFSRLVTAMLPGWSEINGWHLACFLAFQVGVISLYFLARRLTGNWAAFGAALLFSTQPLFWGHAFINPKDIPFMSFFLASVALGLAMIDRLYADPFAVSYAAFPAQSFREDWQRAFLKRKAAIAVLFLLWLGLGIFAWMNREGINNVAGMLVKGIYSSQGFWGRLFLKVAPHADSVAVDNYITKAQTILVKWEIVLFFLTGVALAFILLRLASKRTYTWLLRGILSPAGKATLHYLKSPALILAAIVLGLTISMRLSAPYVVVLVVVYALTKKVRHPWVAFIPYGVLALLTSFLTWPYLWRDPIGRFIDSLKTMSDYSVPGTESSRFMLIKLISIQLTEPVILLFAAGVVLAILNFAKMKFRSPFLLALFWFFLPVTVMLVAQSSLYDNFRQMFFLLPAIFIMVAIALDVLFTKLNKTWLNLAFALAIAMPGIYACIHLHPYEYIYYNSFVGGVKGAFRQYELDYWAISYKEAAEYLNEEAPPNAAIGVIGTDLIFKPYARPDLKVSFFNGVDVGEGFDYVVLTSRANNDLAVCPKAKMIKTIERDGAVLTAIKQVSSPEDCVLSP
jgi:hypothetical protein